ncbi:bacterial Ig-like domain-containing protein [Butyricicoccus sp.]|uniref:bacterial Ig-like domain-containing protein n=1 Tax=Butyricicoccus sp. TaxID=2049021 RepID=UPI003AAA5A06
MKKQWLSIVLVLCMVLCMAPATALAAEGKTCELKITVEVNGLTGSAEGATFTFQIKKAINEVTAQYYEYGTMTVTVGADGTTGTNTIAVEEGKYIVQQVGPGDPIGEYVWYSISYTGGNNESGPQSVYGNGNSTEFKVYNTYRPANVTKVTTLPITVTGYKADAKIADAAVTTTEPGIKLSYFQFMEKDSAGDWTSAPLTGTFKADTEYRVEVYFNKLLGCDYTGLKKENVTVNGVEADAFETTWSGFPYNKDYQVIRGLGKPEVVKTVESIEITKQPDKTEYMAGEDFDPTGMVVTAHYTDGTTADLPETGYTIFRGTGLMQGQTDVTIQYNDGSGSSNIKTYQNITVKPYVGPHTHTYGGPWYADAKSHWHQCTDSACPDPSGSTKDLASHTFVWKVDQAATTTQTGLKHEECTVCSYKRSENTVIDKLPATHSHSYGTEWKYDDTNHWHECECGDKADVAAHSASEWIVDTAATETAEGAKHKECTVCKKVLETATIPATGSTHTHSYGTDWKYDDTNHWHECECRDKADTAAHSFQWVIDKAATKKATGIKHEECTVCGAKRSENTVIAKLSDSGSTGNTGSGNNNTDKLGKDDSTKSPQTGDSSNLIGWLAALFVSGGVLTVLGLNGKKRKESEAE